MTNIGSFVSVFALSPQDKEYHVQDHHGRSPRAMIEQVDGDRLFFTAETGDAAVKKALHFATIHGLQPVSDADMRKLRRAEAP